MTPRPYQSAAMARARQCFAQGAKRVLIVSPTGSGKSCMGAMLAHGHLQKPDRCVVWLAHRTELLDQAARTLHAFGLEVSVRGAHPHRHVQVESVQTILARGKAPSGTFLIPDEAHHFAESNACGAITALYPAIVGLTATPERGDGKPLKPPFDELVVAAQISELTRMGYLVPLRIKCPPHRIAKNKIAQSPVEFYLEHARGLRAIVFASNLTAAESFRSSFDASGVACRVVAGKTPKDEREAILAGHASGRLDVLVNCGVLTEGYDDPGVQCVIVARGCGSQGLWLQMTGRALRPAPSKEYALLGDLRGVSFDLGRPDVDRDFSLDGDPIVVHGRNKGNAERLCRSCHAPLGDLVQCPECGTETAIVPESTGVGTVDFEDVKAEVKERLKPNKLVTALAGMMRKGYERGAVVARFRGIFRRVPDERLWRDAENYNRELKRVERNMTEAMR